MIKNVITLLREAVSTGNANDSFFHIKLLSPNYPVIFIVKLSMSK